ncbi:hypothetical protein EDC96DRAFT_550217 [Choanephora cucurbitarum]|nr:hypothetical protein EDC96DRAFT_550217 [Choanephora cucurbitarum]
MPAISFKNNLTYCFCDVCKQFPQDQRFLKSSTLRSHKSHNKFNNLDYSEWSKTYEGRISRRAPPVRIPAAANETPLDLSNMLVKAYNDFETAQDVQCVSNDHVEQSVETATVAEGSESAPDNDSFDLSMYTFNCK